MARPSSGTAFHSLQATSHALQPMQTEVSVKKPLRAGGSCHPASGAGSLEPDQRDAHRCSPSGVGCAWRGGVRWALPVSTVMPARAR